MSPPAAIAAGGQPTNPITFNSSQGAISLAVGSEEEVWVEVAYQQQPGSSHLQLSTSGALDTELTIYLNAAAAADGQVLAEDDDSGDASNAALSVPLGFRSPLLVHVETDSAGSFSLRAAMESTAAERCDWPAGCPLAVSASEHPGRDGFLGTLREVRGDILMNSEEGRRLSEFYWRMSVDLVPQLIIDGSFRREIYRHVESLLPLAREALDVARGSSSAYRLSNEDVERLEALMVRLRTNLEEGRAQELRALWNRYGLTGRVGDRLSEILQSAGLVESRQRPVVVLAKTFLAPSFDKTSGVGDTGISTGIPGLDQVLSGTQVVGARHVHRRIPQNKTAGLDRTIAIEVASLAEARDLASALLAAGVVQWANVSNPMFIHSAPGRDPFRDELWGLDAVRAPDVWTSAQGDCSRPVAVIDTGVAREVLDLEGRLLPGYDFANDDSDPSDGHGHGTHVSGTIAAVLDNSTSIAGVAPNACILPIKALTDGGDGSEEAIAEAIVYAADEGASIINMSLGCDCDPLPSIEEALEYAAQRDVLIVASSGNDSLDRLGYPAASPWALAVGAVDSEFELADFSNQGEGLDLVAPGVDVVSLFPDGESCFGSGTSMSAPHVSGVAALLRSAMPSLSREDVAEALRSTAMDLGAPGYDTKFGAGIPDSRSALGVMPSTCESETCLPLHGGAFEIRTRWRDFDGNVGTGTIVTSSSNDSGLFWFFNPSNWEMLVKLLDGCALNGHYWLLSAATTNLAYDLEVEHSASGQIRTYSNELGVSAPANIDTEAFPCSLQAGTSVASRESVGLSVPRGETELTPARVGDKSTCQDLSDNLCLNDGRFEVEVAWRDFDGNQGSGQRVPLGAADSGLFWFFGPSNWEMLVKVLDGCSLNERFWVFAAATTNVAYELRITDLDTGRTSTYSNPLGTASPAIIDTGTFVCSP